LVSANLMRYLVPIIARSTGSNAFPHTNSYALIQLFISDVDHEIRSFKEIEEWN
jgi:hypothetical protein